MMRRAVAEVAREHGGSGDVEIEVAIPGGAALAAKTWNPRLGIVGGLSILGTTGIVVPYSCAAWIHAIHSGIDVARASGLGHVAGCTGSTSERAVQQLYGLPDIAMLDMGDFAGGLLKYLRRHPVARLTIGGGFAKISKLAAGHLDLHSGRSQVDLEWLAGLAGDPGGDGALGQSIRSANTANQALELARQAGVPLADAVARRARLVARGVLDGATEVEVLIFDRSARLRGRSDG
jgi:cobalt-precorrin-5B (C1)-methyltransferase